MKLAQLAAVAAGTCPESRAELRRHVRLIAIAEIRCESRERRIPVPQGESEAGQTPKALESAHRHSSLRAERLSDMDGMPVRNRRQFAEAPPPSGFVRDRLDDALDPRIAAERPVGIEASHDFCGERRHCQFFARACGQFQCELMRCDTRSNAPAS